MGNSLGHDPSTGTARAGRSAVSVVHESLGIRVGAVVLQADVGVPEPTRGVVLFVHGSGSSRHSPRNQFVAGELQTAGFATVLADLLTVEEERIDARTGALRFDIELLAARVTALTDWLADYRPTTGQPCGLFGASTGAAAALVAAAERPRSVVAIASRGGRPDLARTALSAVHQPTLLLVGERDPLVIKLNQAAMEKLAGPKCLEVIPSASHLFDEPGTLEQVARLASDWFARHLTREPSGRQDVDHLA
jgi:dienelactone hydrolase